MTTGTDSMALDLDGARRRADKARDAQEVSRREAAQNTETVISPIRSALLSLGRDMAEALLTSGLRPVVITNRWSPDVARHGVQTFTGWRMWSNPGRVPVGFLTTDGYLSSGSQRGWEEYGGEILPKYGGSFGKAGLDSLVIANMMGSSGHPSTGLFLEGNVLFITYDRETSDFGPDYKTFRLDNFLADLTIKIIDQGSA